MFSFLAKRAIPGVESCDGATYYERTIEIGDTRGLMRATPKRDALVVSLPTAFAAHRRGIVARLRRMFDLDADPGVIAARLAKDRLLAPLIAKRPGLRLPGAWDPFEIAVRAIAGQQVSVAAARGVLTKITARYGMQLSEGRCLFPRPEDLSESGALPMPTRRAATIRRVAAALTSGELRFDASADDVIRRLQDVDGIGPWTANYIAMRALGDRDAFPSGDLILRRAAGNLSASQLERRAEAWRPWRAYAVLHLWAG
ncbi:MAG: DNA-3-methyladenine glycosylase 2 family protein [Thermoanaerobaculia bacterium]|nr:DNA-3-methyladenine glycosylase 2 family protein [Thermoanaerobaculia bacterium]